MFQIIQQQIRMDNHTILWPFLSGKQLTERIALWICKMLLLKQ